MSAAFSASARLRGGRTSTDGGPRSQAAGFSEHRNESLSYRVKQLPLKQKELRLNCLKVDASISHSQDTK